MKKFFALLVVVALFCACAFSASAATGITAEEKKIIEALEQKVTMKSGTVVVLPDRYVNQAEDYLTKADLTSDQITDILACIENAVKEVEASDAKNLSAASVEVKTAVIADAKEAAEVINADLHVSDSDKAGEYDAKLVFKAGSTVDGYEAGQEIKLSLSNDEIVQTGAEGNMTAIVIGSAVVLVALAFVVIASRKNALEK